MILDVIFIIIFMKLISFHLYFIYMSVVKGKTNMSKRNEKKVKRKQKINYFGVIIIPS